MNSTEIKQELFQIIDNCDTNLLKDFFNLVTKRIAEIENLKSIVVQDYHIVTPNY